MKFNYSVRYYKGEDWRTVMANSSVSLCPRGTGRTSYHLMEVLQAGLIPVHVHLDAGEGEEESWVPYEGLFDQIGFTTPISRLPSLLENLKGMSQEDLGRREAMAVSLRETHFLMGGALEQIKRFLKSTEVVHGMKKSEEIRDPGGALNRGRVSSPSTDLVCRKLSVFPTMPLQAETQIASFLGAQVIPGVDVSICSQWEDGHFW